LAQSVSHWHEAWQSTPPAQLPVPLQVASQRPVSHSIPPAQALVPSQRIVHSSSGSQRTPPPHEPLPLHVTLQVQPSGHTTGALQPPGSSQRISHVVPVQLEHRDGHEPASMAGRTTHSPSTQVRSLGHPGSHANSPERESMLHAASASAIVTSARFTTHLPAPAPRRPA
jgi:hypothetical protein